MFIGHQVTIDLGLLRIKASGFRVQWQKKKRMAEQARPCHAMPGYARLGILWNLDVRTLFFLCSS